MAIDPEETRARLDRLLREADAGVPERPVDPGAPVLRARRAIRFRYAVIAVSFVALAVVLTAGAVFARDRLDGTDGATGPTGTGPTGGTATGPGPKATINDHPPKLTNEPEGTFEFTIKPPAPARCTLNGEQVAEPCRSPVTVPATEGENTFEVVGIDDQGRPGKPATYTWTLDTFAPTVQLTSVELVYAPTVDDVSCSVDLQSASCTDTAEGLSSGQHSFLVSLPYDWDLTWILSATPPTATFIGAGDIADPETSTVRFLFDANDSETVECLSEGTTPIPCEQGVLTDSVTNTGTAPITRTLEIVAIDEAGNRGTPLAFSWSFDAVDTSVV